MSRSDSDVPIAESWARNERNAMFYRLQPPLGKRHVDLDCSDVRFGMPVFRTCFLVLRRFRLCFQVSLFLLKANERAFSELKHAPRLCHLRALGGCVGGRGGGFHFVLECLIFRKPINCLVLANWMHILFHYVFCFAG